MRQMTQREETGLPPVFVAQLSDQIQNEFDRQISTMMTYRRRTNGELNYSRSQIDKAEEQLKRILSELEDSVRHGKDQLHAQASRQA